MSHLKLVHSAEEVEKPDVTRRQFLSALFRTAGYALEKGKAAIEAHTPKEKMTRREFLGG